MPELIKPLLIPPSIFEAILEFGGTICQAKEFGLAMDEITTLARKMIVFDNFVLYTQPDSIHLEPIFARAIGRGRTTEADLAWGEIIANQAIKMEQAIIQQEVIDQIPSERMKNRFLLGLPILIHDHNLGALVFVRYGGPPFTTEQIPLAKFIVSHIAQLLEHESMVSNLNRLEAERQIDRLQDDFVSTISHELRTPLGFIKGYATTLLRNDTVWEESTRHEFLTVIDEEADKLRDLIDNLLDSSRLQSGTLQMDFQPIRLETLLKDIVLRARSFHEILVELNIGSEGIQIQADPTRLAQVFDNLLSNAAKYAPGSKVTISTALEENRVHIIVSDDGPGIAPEHLNKLFTRFFRVPDQSTVARGTGLGLFICRRIIRNHEGDIIAESTPRQGLTLHIYLPCTIMDPSQ